MYYLFADLESDGLPKNWSAPVNDFQNWPRIVELGWILTDFEGNEVNSAVHIIKPDGFIIPDNMIHGISNDQAIAEGVPLRDVMKLFMEDAEKSSHIVCHNTSFDTSVIACELFRLGMKNIMAHRPHLCTMKLSTGYCKIPNGRGGSKFPKLQELHKHLFGEEFDGAHGAMADIKATKRCFFELQARGIIGKPTTTTMTEKIQTPAAPSGMEKFAKKEVLLEGTVIPAAITEQTAVATEDTTPEILNAPKRKRRTKAELLADAAKSVDEYNSGEPVANPILAMVPSSGVPVQLGQEIAQSLQAFFDTAIEWNETIKTLVITDPNDKGKMAVAKQGRLALKNKRLDAEKLIKANREKVKARMASDKAEDDLWLKAGQIIETTFKTLESRLEEKEKFAEKADAEAKEELKNQRAAELSAYLTPEQIGLHDLVNMNEFMFQSLLKTVIQMKKDNDAEAARVAQENADKEKALADSQNIMKALNIRLAQLSGVSWNGEAAVYKDTVVVSKSSLISLSDVAFNSIASVHNARYAQDQEIAKKEKLQRRISRFEDIGLDHRPDTDSMTTTDSDIFVSIKVLATMNDEEIDKLAIKVKDFLLEKKKAESQKLVDMKINGRKQRLKDLGMVENAHGVLECDNLVATNSLLNSWSDEQFETVFNKAKSLLTPKAAVALPASSILTTDNEKIGDMIERLKLFQLPECGEPASRKMVGATRVLLGKIVTYLESQRNPVISEHSYDV